MKGLHYFVYIVTNPNKTVFYTGVTNDLAVRLEQHYQNRGNKASFAGKYHCYKLLYFETFSGIEQAIFREKKLKGGQGQRKKH
jgi:putative endonuclease